MNTANPQSYSQNHTIQHSGALQVLQQYMRWEEGDTVLDVGCGTGEICKYISQQPGVASVVGFDLSPDFISYASHHNSSPNVLYHVADASDVSTIKPEWKGAFSKVVSFSVLHWIQDKASALKVLNSCLKSRGEIVFICNTEEAKVIQLWMGIASHPKWELSLKDLGPFRFPWLSSDLTNDRHSSRLMEECGFEVISCQVKDSQHRFHSVNHLKEALRAVSPYQRYIPQDKHDDLLDDLIKMAEGIHMISGEDVVYNDTCLVVHARKL